MKRFFEYPLVVPAIIISIGIIIATFIGAYAFYQIRSFDNGLVVTGSAKQTVTADSAKWSFVISRTVDEYGLQNGYAQMAADAKKAKAFLTSKSIEDSGVMMMPIVVGEVYHSEQYTGPHQYTLTQTITVQSSDIQKISSIASEVQELVGQGVFIQPNQPEYYYSKLADLRVSLLANAIKDAKARAEQIAKSNGNGVGTLKAASSGVVQVTAPNSINIDDFGQYDTTTIQKDVSVTVRATFVIR